MNDPKLYYSPNRPTRLFQGEEKEDINVYSSESGKHFYQKQLSHETDGNFVGNAISLPEKATNSTARHLLFVALLEYVCNINEPNNPNKARELFQMLCKHLRKMKVIDPLKSIDELCTIRSQCRKSFIKLMQGCLTTIDREGRPQTVEERVQLFLQPRIVNNQPALELASFHTSRFEEDYVQVKELGAGAYGSVYEATYKVDDCNYAIKKIGFVGYEEEMWYKILREVKFLANLSHQNIVRYHHAWIEYEPEIMFTEVENREGEPIEAATFPRALQYSSAQVEGLNLDRQTTDIDSYDDDSVVFEHSQTSQKTVLENNSNNSSRDNYSRASHMQKPCVFVYIQMELCHTNLKDWLENRNNLFSEGNRSALNREINLSILKQLFKAVRYIHSTDVIHRDLKPHNIFIRCSGNFKEIKVGDFGLSRTIRSSSEIPGSGTTPLTPHPGVSNIDFDWTQYTSGVGTTIYASPEQLTGSDYSQKSDMYSLGLIMYEIYQPFGTEMERKKCLTDLRKNDIPEEFKSVWPDESEYIQALLSHDPEGRPTAREMLETKLFLSKDKIIENLKSSIEEKDSLIKEKDSIIYQLKKQLKEKEEENSLKDAEIETLKFELMTLKPPSYTSLSKSSEQ